MKKEERALQYGDILRDALALAQSTVSNDPVLAEIANKGEVYDNTMNMKASSVAFRNRVGKRQSCGYTWEWIDNRSVEEIAQDIVQEINDAIAEGRLP